MTAIERSLTPEARSALDADEPTRRKLLRTPSFVMHTAIRKIVTRLDEALEDYPTKGDSYLLVVADSGMGKSTLAKWYYERHTVIDIDANAPAAQVTVLYISLVTGSAKGFLGRILEKLKIKPNPSYSAEVLYPLVLRLLRRIGVKLLIIDEFHHAGDGVDSRVTELLNYIKVLGNDLNITIAAFGEGGALPLVQRDTQIARRFEPMPLHRWQQGDEYDALLDALEARLPLEKASNLSSPRTSKWILSRTEGLTSAIDELIRDGARKAVSDGLPCIDLALLRSLDFIPPSRRVNVASAALAVGRPG